eukprot:3025317-Prymnesium_polylepis.1
MSESNNRVCGAVSGHHRTTQSSEHSRTAFRGRPAPAATATRRPASRWRRRRAAHSPSICNSTTSE